MTKPLMKQLFLFLSVFYSSISFAEPSLEPKSCQRIQQDICVDSMPCKKFNGVTSCLSGVPLPDGSIRINATCWQYQSTFRCLRNDIMGTCQRLRDRGCGQIGSSCLTTGLNGSCLTASFTFSCPDKPPISEKRTVCEKSFCTGDAACFDTSSPPDTDFGQAAAMMEAARQAGVYGIDPNKVEIFKGYSEECSVKVIGGAELKSCCTAAGGGAAYTNNALLNAGLAAGGVVGGEALKSGSSYVYDALYGQLDSSLIDKGLASMNDWASGLGGSSNFGAYGFTFSYSMEAGFSFVGFDPTSFAIAVAIQIITEWLQCEPEEQAFQMKRGQNLCVYIGSYCSSEVLGVCTEIKQRSCCFNSVLAKTVNQQGRKQLEMPLNQCGGFNQAQIEAIDFSVMNFSEFIASINVAPVNNAALNEHVNDTVKEKINDYYQQ